MKDRKKITKISNSIKEKIKTSLDNGNSILALSMIDEYEKLIDGDIEILCMKAIALIMLSKIEEAIKTLKKALSLDKKHIDTLYNLAYAYELKSYNNEAIKFYKKVIENCTDNDLIIELEEKINIIEAKFSTKNRKKIAFFVKPNMDAFIDDIIELLCEEYDTEKIIVTNTKEIDEWMEWSDICWFEWCDELVHYASYKPLARERKIICRIHGYEVYTPIINSVFWQNVDNIIIVTEHIKRLFLENLHSKYRNLNINVIHCGVDVEKYRFKKRDRGFNIGYLGLINYKKNIPLTLDIFKKLYLKDNRYKLYIAGKFQDKRTLEYFKYFIKENDLKDSIFFEGWKNEEEKIEWLKKIDYMLISSIDEGLCYAAAEAMCSGIKPILHNCEGIKEHYKKEYIFNDIDEAMKMILEKEYDSSKYRQFILDNYNNSEKIKLIKKTVE